MAFFQGWRWVNEGKSPLRPKWGYVTERLGDSLLVRVRRCLHCSSACPAPSLHSIIGFSLLAHHRPSLQDKLDS